MKNILVFLAALLAAMLFASCDNSEEYEFINGSGEASSSKPQTQETLDNNEEKTDKEKEENQTPKQTKAEIDALAAAALEKMSVIPQYPAGYPTLEDVVAQYERANEAIGWIVGTELVANDGDDSYTAKGMKYNRVLPDCYLGSKKAGKNPDADKLIYNKETLQAYFATLIHPDEARDYILDITESFDVPKFVENSVGALYVLPYAFPAAGYGEENTYELKKNNDESYTLYVHYTTLDENDEVKGEHTYAVDYIKLDGRWVFENFIVIKQH